MQVAITHIRPAIDRDNRVVVAWRWRVTVTVDGASTFDEVKAQPDVGRPLEQWTQRDVRAFLEAYTTDRWTLLDRRTGEMVSGLGFLRDEAFRRARTQEVPTFDLGTLAP